MAPSAKPPFSLRPMPTGDRKPKNLAEFIARVNVQSGGFRNVREEDLRREVAAQNQKTEAADVEMDDASEPEADTELAKDTRAARDEILRNIEIAHRNAMLTLDFVSLLLSKETPVQAGMTLSPELREMVGIGTLGASNLSASNLTQGRVQENKLVAVGRKLLDINKTADTVLSAATRLQQEIKLETIYWADVLAVSEGGWSVSRLQQEQHTMGVKFGFSESGLDFRTNTVAPMRRADSGSVNLDTGSAGGSSKRLLVSIEKNGKVVGRSAMTEPLSNEASLDSHVLEARNSAFAQELWHEINREGRTLLSYNVRLEPTSVTVGLDANTNIIFRLVTLGEDSETDGKEKSHDEDGNAESIRTALSLLLCYGHRQNARKRSQQPRLSGVQGRTANQPQMLLRPLLAYLQHENSIQSCILFLSDLVGILHAAGISEASYSITEQPITLNSAGSASESLIGVLLNPLNFRADLTITPDARLDIVGNTFTSQYITGFFRIGLLPPVSATKPSAEVDDGPPDFAANSLFYAFPPGDSFPNLREVFFYLRQAVPRVLALKYEALAQEWTASSLANSEDGSVDEQQQPSDEPPLWIGSISGTAVRDRDTEKRGVRFELTTATAARGADEGEETGAAEAADESLRLRELQLVGDLLVEGKMTRKVWAWGVDGSGDKAKLEDAVKEVILPPGTSSQPS